VFVTAVFRSDGAYSRRRASRHRSVSRRQTRCTYSV